MILYQRNWKKNLKRRNIKFKLKEQLLGIFKKIFPLFAISNNNYYYSFKNLKHNIV